MQPGSTQVYSASGRDVQPVLTPILLLKMATTIENPVECDIHPDIHFLWTKNCTTATVDIRSTLKVFHSYVKRTSLLLVLLDILPFVPG